MEATSSDIVFDEYGLYSPSQPLNGPENRSPRQKVTMNKTLMVESVAGNPKEISLARTKTAQSSVVWISSVDPGKAPCIKWTINADIQMIPPRLEATIGWSKASRSSACTHISRASSRVIRPRIWKGSELVPLALS